MRPASRTGFACAALLPVAVATYAPPAGAIDATLTEVTLGLSSAHSRPVVPTIQVVYSGGRWRLLNKKITFVLRVYVRANVGTKVFAIQLVAPAPQAHPATTWMAYSRSTGDFGATRRVRVQRTVHSYNAVHLRSHGQRAVSACARALPNGRGKIWVNQAMAVDVIVSLARSGAAGTIKRTARRTITARVMCTGSDSPQRAGPSFKVTGASVVLINQGTNCPRTVFAKVFISSNIPGRVQYVLRTDRAFRWNGTVVINFQQGGRYRGSYSHRFNVGRSTRMRFWVTIDGRKVGRPSFLQVNCVRRGRSGGFKN